MGKSSKALAAYNSDEGKFGPAMTALSSLQRAFVTSMLETGKQNNKLHAQNAGYTGDDATLRVTGHRLAHDSKVQAAIREEAERRMGAAAIVATSRLIEFLDDPDKKLALKAAQTLLNRVGLHERTEHKSIVEHTADAEGTIARIRALAIEQGFDPKKLLGTAGVKDDDVVDAEFEEVERSTEGLEDLL